MLTTLAVAGIIVYGIGLRADRIHAERAVTELGVASGKSVSSLQATSPGSVTPRLYGGHSAGYWNWQYRVAKRQSLNAVRYARKLERIIRERRHPAPTRTLYASSGGSVENAICVTFGSYCSQAVAVARCESGLSVGASNGQYLGLFQMGEYARARYGHSGDAWGQARAAYSYFRESGYSWSPWTCKP